MPPAGFEPTIPASKRPQTHTLDRASAGIAAPTFISWLQPADTQAHSWVHPEWVNDLLSLLFIEAKQLSWTFNLLKPTGHVMHQQFNIQQL